MINPKAPKPMWLKVKPFSGENYQEVREILNACHINTVCDEALCPNRGTCFNDKTATFIILGKVCTRNCRFCNVHGGSPEMVDPDEPKNIAKAVNQLGLRYVVITCVTRDDLPDGGADHFYQTITEIKKLNPNTAVEALVSDLKGNLDALTHVLDASPEVLSHNVETVPTLYEAVRPAARYNRSLRVIKAIKEIKPNAISKSGFMVGLGETRDEVIGLMEDLRKVDCDVLTIGQYLRPSMDHYPVMEYVHPDVFAEYERLALEMGFKAVSSSPMTRSSYLAHKAYQDITQDK